MKLAKYSQLLFTDLSNPIVTLQDISVVTIPDVTRNGFCFTDGCGQISADLIQELFSSTCRQPPSASSFTPCVIQVRLPGVKGVLVASTQLGKRRIELRQSMRKLYIDSAFDEKKASISVLRSNAAESKRAKLQECRATPLKAKLTEIESLRKRIERTKESLAEGKKMLSEVKISIARHDDEVSRLQQTVEECKESLQGWDAVLLKWVFGKSAIADRENNWVASTKKLYQHHAQAPILRDRRQQLSDSCQNDEVLLRGLEERLERLEKSIDFEMLDGYRKLLKSLLDLERRRDAFRNVISKIVRVLEASSDSTGQNNIQGTVHELDCILSLETEMLHTDLPIYNCREDVVGLLDSMLQVGIVLSETGSGKSTCIPQFLANHLHLAGLDHEKIEAFFGTDNFMLIEVEGRSHPVEEHFEGSLSSNGAEIVDSAIKKVLKIHQSTTLGELQDILVFLPRTKDIEEWFSRLRKTAIMGLGRELGSKLHGFRLHSQVDEDEKDCVLNRDPIAKFEMLEGFPKALHRSRDVGNAESTLDSDTRTTFAALQVAAVAPAAESASPSSSPAHMRTRTVSEPLSASNTGTDDTRRVIFATNIAETSLTIGPQKD
ncbi:hypothetical protein HK102_003324 [Quaeritorhiza haematococci]|nr:hypothetical protein HK102_003324 [Quaeritorhiza haematococci]